MSEASRSDRQVLDTSSQIKRAARGLLVEHGVEGVTLRAIARKLGLTAPALYRYYRSHSQLLEQLRGEISVELAEELSEDVARLPDDGIGQFFAVCRGFRRWALAHPHEFTLVFASVSTEPASAPLTGANEPFGRVFITSMARVLVSHELAGLPDDLVPAALRNDVAAFRQTVLDTLARQGVRFDPHRLPLEVAFLMVQYWIRIYGHVTLEVFGNFPMTVSQPDVLFDAMLAELARELGLGAL
ncbi:TetR/AcrR family transcriptional regulator [Haloechinothrix salitolerans]|uniref:TetR/AcrR family transcriptional regulator n=1 Tax=Haloechinothrix salitolerans TaxID=926830 RepID=A0ABW2BT99_9PSEU